MSCGRTFLFINLWHNLRDIFTNEDSSSLVLLNPEVVACIKLRILKLSGFFNIFAVPPPEDK